MKRRMLMAGLGALALAGCGFHQGKEFHMERANQLVPGQTTLAQATALLGEPVQYEQVAAGRKVSWYHKEVVATPLPGLGGASQKILSVVFDKNDVMVEVAKSSTIGTGIMR